MHPSLPLWDEGHRCRQRRTYDDFDHYVHDHHDEYHANSNDYIHDHHDDHHDEHLDHHHDQHDDPNADHHDHDGDGRIEYDVDATTRPGTLTPYKASFGPSEHRLWSSTP